MTDTFYSAHIVCDASYNSVTFIAGVAGTCVIVKDGEFALHGMYQGAMPEIPNSNEAEMLAIEAGAKELRRLVRAGRFSVRKLNIHSDSTVAAKTIKNLILTGDCDPRYKEQATVTLNALLQVVAVEQLSFHKVKAHVPDDDAEPVEGLHNLVDKKAKSARTLFENHLFSPQPQVVGEKTFVGVVSPAKVHPKDHIKFITLGEHLALKYDKVRLFFNEILPSGEAVQNHPLMIGLTQGAEKSGRSLKDVLAKMSASPRPDMLPPSEGSDRTLLRSYVYQYTADMLSSRIAKGRTLHPRQLSGLDAAKDIHAASPNITLKLPLDQAESLYKALQASPLLHEQSSNHVETEVNLCESLRKNGAIFYFLSPFACNKLQYLQDNYLEQPLVSLPNVLIDELQNHYYDWSTVPEAMIPDHTLGYLYQRLLYGERANPTKYGDPLQSMAHALDFKDPLYRNSGAASRLLFGPETYSRLNIDTPTGRIEPPCVRAINLCDNDYPVSLHSLSAWFDKITTHINMPYTKGVDNALQLYKLATPSQERKDYLQIEMYLKEHLSILEAPQIRRGVCDILQQQGISDSRALQNVINQHCHDNILRGLHDPSDIRSFTERLLQHAEIVHQDHLAQLPPKESLYPKKEDVKTSLSSHPGLNRP